MGTQQEHQRVLAITPFAEPCPRLAAAAARADARSVLDLGRDRTRAADALRRMTDWWSGPFGVRIGPGAPLTPEELPEAVNLVVLAANTVPAANPVVPAANPVVPAANTVPAANPVVPAANPVVPAANPVDVYPEAASWSIAAARGRGREVLVEVGSLVEAIAAVAAGADALIARGCESGGRVGSRNTFVLLQEILAADLRHASGSPLPVWAAGGIGPHTAAAAVAGGADGVVLDSQLALVQEAELPREVTAALRRMDGTETAVVGGYRIYVRPDLVRPSAEGIETRIGGRGLEALPVGEDGALALPLAQRYCTVGGVVAAVADGISSGLAAVTGTRGRKHLPRVVQGPMTRVSDQAAFAAAVAAEGGLPFIALALLSGEDARALLVETSEALGDRPWGVGILGFVPDDVRDAQLAAVHEIRPPYALIAGGRPSQARPLEAAGITTYLHAPSPALLERFLAEGARRFVFEGSECGGHVGPRASFPLWEQQLQRLADFGVANGCADSFDVLFAGGIHDARSAAMVSAAAAPLAEAGASVGLLMGTAYLFTREAVSTGAIGPAFQRAALACGSTVLLQTAPGHATRCADTPFVGAFNETRERRLREGAAPEQVWAELEALNIGRLRIASKGIRREGKALIPVDERTQARDGMVMIGDIAAMRSSVTTIAELHAEVTTGAAAFLRDRALALAAATLTTEGRPGAAGGPLDIAVVGMAGVFPQAGDLGEFWSNILRDHDAITEVPAERWDPATYFTGDGATLDGRRGSTSKWGGFLPEIPFDALRYGIPPAALASIEPVQLLSLEVAARALRDAGYSGVANPPGATGSGERPFDRERTAVVFGAEPGTDLSAAYGFRALYPQLHGELPPDLDAQLPELTEDSFPGVLANVISGRIANRLDLGGANYTVDAACASALAALEVACLQLRSGAADMVLAGGADVHNGISDFLMFASVGALSPTGHCRPFDASADGIALGEGVACIVLKRLVDAERDGDRIYAVVAGVGSASDGRSLGLTAPRPEGQRRAIERAYAQAGVSPAELGLVEAHGTGTVVGDRTELGVLTELFTEAGAAVGGCALGSVKSQIGHTKCTAGLAGLIKVALAVYNGVLPPTGKITTPNPAWSVGSSPFVFDDSPRPWPSGRRVAGISAFGFGGTNFHAVLTGYRGAPAPRHGLDHWPAELFLFGGSNVADALVEVEQLATLCAANDAAGRPARLRDLARTTADRGAQPIRFALVATDLDDLAAKIAYIREGRPHEGVFATADLPDGVSIAAGSEVAVLFPGQGSQRPGMLADLFTAFPRRQDLLALGARWASAMFPPAAFDDAAREAAVATLKDTRVAQPALGIAGLAMFATLSELGVHPGHLGGHSYGELVALAAAGALEPTELPELSEARGRAILAAAGADPGTMAAVSAGPAEVRAALNGTAVVIANLNGPTQTVISGPTRAIAEATKRLTDAGLRAAAIPVACAFHSPVVAEASRTFEVELLARTVGSPHLPVWSNATAAPYPLGCGAVRELLAEQITSPVRFTDQIEAMYAAGAHIFVECGPGGVLTGLVRSILGDRPHLAIATDAPGRHGIHSLLLALGRLAVAGVPVDTAPLYTGRDAEPVRAQSLPSRPGWSVNGHLVRTADGAPVAGGLRPAVRVPIAPEPVTASVDTGAREAVVLEFLRNSRELLAAQRDVVLGYLGAEQQDAAPSVRPVPGAGTVDRASMPVPANGRRAAAPLRVGDRSAAGENVRHRSAVAAEPAVDPAGTNRRAASGGPAEGSPAYVSQVLTELISERTGYPAAMLDADLDLEADLSIGSLKRTEIIGLLADRLRAAGLSCAPDDARQAELTRIRTVRGIVTRLTEPTATGHAPTEHPPTEPTPGEHAVPALGTHPVPARPRAGQDRNLVDVPRQGTGPRAQLTQDQIRIVLVELISERTGYPAAMLDIDLDLEADLSIGSLKRTEIIGLLADRLTGGLDETLATQLTRLRTLRAIVARITEADIAPAASEIGSGGLSDVDRGEPAFSGNLSTSPRSAVGSTPITGATRSPVRRYLLETVPIAPAPAGADLTGRHVTLVSGSAGIAIELAAVLESCGATVRSVSTAPDEELGDVDILVHLGAAGPSEPPSLPDAFAVIRRAVLGGAGQLLVATGHGGRFAHRGPGEPGSRNDFPAGVGLAGLVRTVAREYPEISCRVLDLDPKELPWVLAGHLVDELRSPDGPEVVGYTEGVRCSLSLVEAPLPVEDRRVALPRGVDLGLHDRSVVLLTGGARGITAQVARGLAEVSGCHLVLWGRSPDPGPDEDPRTATATDAAALRGMLISDGIGSPAQIERAVRTIRTEREIRASLAGLRQVAASVEYRAVDVRDFHAVTDAMADLRARHGRIDGVVHGAGVLDDRLIADKTDEGFLQVWETKVEGARALAAGLDSDVRFLVLFGSVSGVFGNRGQCDYAAANDALDCLAHAWEDRFSGRVVSIDWGPWMPSESPHGDGMVSPELLRSYDRQGVAAMHADDGVAAALNEIAFGTTPQVVYVCAEPSAFDAAFSAGRSTDGE